MIFRRRKVEHAREQSGKTDDLRATVQSQWPEVRDLAAWAKSTREANHLTQLFLASRGNR